MEPGIKTDTVHEAANCRAVADVLARVGDKWTVYVVKLLAKVSAEDRHLILLKEVEGHSVEELAALTGLNENTIKVKLFRTRQKLLKAAQRLGKFRMSAS